MILQLFRIVLQKKEQRRLFFFYSEAGILHGKRRAVDLQDRMRQERRWFSAVFCCRT